MRILTVRFHMQRGNARESGNQRFQFSFTDNSDIQDGGFGCSCSGPFTLCCRAAVCTER
ncbi:hypothetical protein D3C71_2198130 [compost metagenome]